MSSVVLLELSAGYGLVQVKGPERFSLLGWRPFKDSDEAFRCAQELVDGELGKTLQSFLKKKLVDEKIKDKLIVLDAKVGGAIKDSLKIPCIFAHGRSAEMQTYKQVRMKVCDLIKGLSEKALHQTALGLAAKLDQFKLKFNPERLDTLVVQAISMLDDLDKELNIYAMRLKEWYGWHFPEMHKLVSDNATYAKLVLKIGRKSNAKDLDLTEGGLVDDDVEAAVKAAALVSPGIDIADDDEKNILSLAEEVVATSRYRQQLAEYIRSRMMTLSPSITLLVGEIIGARLLSAAGSLQSLAKAPASTVQILGAENAFFKALKKRTQTPKYGLLYHAAFVSKAPPAFRGRMARTLAARAALCARMDAFREDTKEDGEAGEEFGEDCKAYCDRRLAALEGLLTSSMGRGGGAPRGRAQGRESAYDRSASQTARRERPSYDDEPAEDRGGREERRERDTKDAKRSSSEKKERGGSAKKERSGSAKKERRSSEKKERSGSEKKERGSSEKKEKRDKDGKRDKERDDRPSKRDRSDKDRKSSKDSKDAKRSRH